MFVGRKRELALLERRWGSGVFEFIGIYGRRRVGKTALIGEFARTRRTGWCAAVEDDASMNLKLLSQAVYALGNPDADPESAPVYADFRLAIDAAFDAARAERALLVIDEFPYLAKSAPSFASILQAAIDRNQESSKLFLVLCGSSLSFMKEQLLGKGSPLYGRRTAQIELRPFDFFEARAFFPDARAVDAAGYYGMVGGIPLYLRQFDGALGMRENIERVFLDPGAILFEEATNLLKQEVSKAAPYNAVISAIAGGASQHNEIAARAGFESSAVDYYLKELVRIGIVSREEPITGRGGRKALWRIDDNLFGFWYRFVRPRQSLIERGLIAGVALRIAERLPEHMGPVFERICRDWIWRRLVAGQLPFAVTDIGRWWGNDPQAKSEAEIDIVAIDEAETVLVGECKWQSAPTDAGVLAKLDGRAHLAGARPETPRCLFSRSGFAPSCIELAAQMGNARLMTFEDLIAAASEFGL